MNARWKSVEGNGTVEIGNILRENELIPQAILSSPASRASETAEIVAKESGFPGKITFIDFLLYGWAWRLYRLS